MKEKDSKDTHPGFTIICDTCLSKNVYIDNSQGWSQTSGNWGSVDLVCNDCGKRTELT